MNYGWIKLHRKTLKSSVWEKPNVWRVWSWCLLKANHKTQKFPFAGNDIIIKAGQFITGTNKACKELELTCQKYRTAINYLKNSKRITTKSTNQFTIITVINWRKYQPIDYDNNKQISPKLTNEQQTANKRLTTNKKKKKIREKLIRINLSLISEESRKDIKIIYLFAYKKEIPSFNQDTQKSFITRNVKAAQLLKGYPIEKIEKVMDYLEKNADFKWTLETVSKFIDENLEKLTKSQVKTLSVK